MSSRSQNTVVQCSADGDARWASATCSASHQSPSPGNSTLHDLVFCAKGASTNDNQVMGDEGEDEVGRRQSPDFGLSLEPRKTA